MAKRKYPTSALPPIGTRCVRHFSAMARYAPMFEGNKRLIEGVFFGLVARPIFDVLLMDDHHMHPATEVFFLQLDKAMMIWDTFANFFEIPGVRGVVVVCRASEIGCWKPYENRLASMGIMSAAFASEQYSMAREYAADVAGVPARSRAAWQIRSA